MTIWASTCDFTIIPVDCLRTVAAIVRARSAGLHLLWLHPIGAGLMHCQKHDHLHRIDRLLALNETGPTSFHCSMWMTVWLSAQWRSRGCFKNRHTAMSLHHLLFDILKPLTKDDWFFRSPKAAENQRKPPRATGDLLGEASEDSVRAALTSCPQISRHPAEKLAGYCTRGSVWASSS